MKTVKYLYFQYTYTDLINGLFAFTKYKAYSQCFAGCKPGDFAFLILAHQYGYNSKDHPTDQIKLWGEISKIFNLSKYLYWEAPFMASNPNYGNAPRLKVVIYKVTQEMLDEMKAIEENLYS